MNAYRAVKVLVIDDEPFSRFMVKNMLAQLGITKVAEAEDGAAGLVAYAAMVPDVVICDYEMSPVDGMTFLRALQGELGYFRRLAPVIFLTSHAEAELVREASRHGAAAFLVKPATTLELKKRLDHVLGSGVNNAAE